MTCWNGWNPWGICNERYNHCHAMIYNVNLFAVLTELNNVHNKRDVSWVASEDKDYSENGKYTRSRYNCRLLFHPTQNLLPIRYRR